MQNSLLSREDINGLIFRASPDPQATSSLHAIAKAAQNRILTLDPPPFPREHEHGHGTHRVAFSRTTRAVRSDHAKQCDVVCPSRRSSPALWLAYIPISDPCTDTYYLPTYSTYSVCVCVYVCVARALACTWRFCET